MSLTRADGSSTWRRSPACPRGMMKISSHAFSLLGTQNLDHSKKSEREKVLLTNEKRRQAALTSYSCKISQFSLLVTWFAPSLVHVCTYNQSTAYLMHTPLLKQIWKNKILSKLWLQLCHSLLLLSSALVKYLKRMIHG